MNLLQSIKLLYFFNMDLFLAYIPFKNYLFCSLSKTKQSKNKYYQVIKNHLSLFSFILELSLITFRLLIFIVSFHVIF